MQICRKKQLTFSIDIGQWKTNRWQTWSTDSSAAGIYYFFVHIKYLHKCSTVYPHTDIVRRHTKYKRLDYISPDMCLKTGTGW